MFTRFLRQTYQEDNTLKIILSGLNKWSGCMMEPIFKLLQTDRVEKCLLSEVKE